MIPNIISLRRK